MQARSLPFFALFGAHLFGSGYVARHEFVAKRAVVPGDDGGAQVGGETQHKTNIMDAAQAIVEIFSGSQQVMQVGRAIVATGVAIAALFDGAALRSKTGRFDVDAASAREESAVPGDAGGQDAIEH